MTLPTLPARLASLHCWSWSQNMLLTSFPVEILVLSAADDTTAAAVRFNSSSTHLSSLSSSVSVEVSEPQSFYAFSASVAVRGHAGDASYQQLRRPMSRNPRQLRAWRQLPKNPPLHSNNLRHNSASVLLCIRSCTEALNAPTVTRLHLFQASGSRNCQPRKRATPTPNQAAVLCAVSAC